MSGFCLGSELAADIELDQRVVRGNEGQAVALWDGLEIDVAVGEGFVRTGAAGKA